MNYFIVKLSLIVAIIPLFAVAVEPNLDRWAETMSIWGYQWEKYDVTTDDGYILTTFRITGDDKGNPLKPTKPPVVIVHGLYMDALVWMIGQDLNLFAEKPFQLGLADAGYDVYLANSRGTRYSQRHIEYDPIQDAAQFWNFTWADMGLYDVRANIELAVNNSNFDKAFYIGYSQGTAQMFYSLAKLEEEFH